MTDEQLLTYLAGMETRLAGMETRLNDRIDVSEKRVMQLIESHSQELETLGHQANSRLDAIQARLDR
jgi:hypothetical protein